MRGREQHAPAPLVDLHVVLRLRVVPARPAERVRDVDGAPVPRDPRAAAAHLAEEVREILATLGFTSLEEVIGRTDLLTQVSRGDAALDDLDLNPILVQAERDIQAGSPRDRDREAVIINYTGGPSGSSPDRFPISLPLMEKAEEAGLVSPERRLILGGFLGMPASE